MSVSAIVHHYVNHAYFCMKNFFNILQVYFYLLKMYLQPPPSSSLGMSASQGVKPKQNNEAAFKLLEEHATKIDVSKVMSALL